MDVTKALKFSHHRNANTFQAYNDAEEGAQSEIAAIALVADHPLGAWATLRHLTNL